MSAREMGTTPLAPSAVARRMAMNIGALVLSALEAVRATKAESEATITDLRPTRSDSGPHKRHHPVGHQVGGHRQADHPRRGVERLAQTHEDRGDHVRLGEDQERRCGQDRQQPPRRWQVVWRTRHVGSDLLLSFSAMNSTTRHSRCEEASRQAKASIHWKVKADPVGEPERRPSPEEGWGKAPARGFASAGIPLAPGRSPGTASRRRAGHRRAGRVVSDARGRCRVQA